MSSETLVTAVVLLSGCSATQRSDGTSDGIADTPDVTSLYVDTIDGHRVLCVWARQGYGGGVSCDWEHR